MQGICELCVSDQSSLLALPSSAQSGTLRVYDVLSADCSLLTEINAHKTSVVGFSCTQTPQLIIRTTPTQAIYTPRELIDSFNTLHSGGMVGVISRLLEPEACTHLGLLKAQITCKHCSLLMVSESNICCDNKSLSLV